MSLEMQALVQAIHEQTQAINRLVESNATMISLLVESTDGDAPDPEEYEYDLSGKRIAN